MTQVPVDVVLLGFVVVCFLVAGPFRSINFNRSKH